MAVIWEQEDEIEGVSPREVFEGLVTLGGGASSRSEHGAGEAERQ